MWCVCGINVAFIQYVCMYKEYVLYGMFGIYDICGMIGAYGICVCIGVGYVGSVYMYGVHNMYVVCEQYRHVMYVIL